MAEQTYTLLFSEVLDKVHKAKTKSQKVAILREHNTDSLRMLLKASFDPTKEWVMPEGEVPYTPNDAPAGTEHTVLQMEAKNLWRFIKSEAKLLVLAKDKKLHQHYKGLSAAVVKEAFGWNDNFMKPEPDRYPQASRSASGLVAE